MIYVVGNSVAALSAVATISQREEVTWLQKPGRKGGVFGGIEIDGISCDIGMLNFELGAATNRKTNSVVEYDRQRINDCANFSQIIDEISTNGTCQTRGCIPFWFHVFLICWQTEGIR